jgi:hypothetical protein
MYIIRSLDYRFVSLTIPDVIIAITLISFIFVFGYLYSKKKKETDSVYRYFNLGLLVHVFGVIGFCLVYLLYYEGDTLDYFNSAVSVNNVLFTEPSHYFSILFGGNTSLNWTYFSSVTGYPEWHIWKDPTTFFVVRLFAPICLLGLNSFVISSILVACITFVGPWKLYRLLCSLYPHLGKYFVFSALMVPSVVFWGSGILKDSITLCTSTWLTYCMFSIFFTRRKVFINICILILMAFLTLSIKPYIFVSIIPGLLIWLFVKWVMRVKNVVVRILIAPTAIIFALLGAVLLISSMGESLGIYGNVDTMIEKVKVTQEDLTRSSQYGSNFFDIGKFDATPAGLISKAPAAIIAGLFRPFIWEAGNPFIVISGLENLFLVFLLIYSLIKTGIKTYINSIFQDPFLTFSLVFSVMFAFGVGLASANFGALVRYKIPLLPFFVSGMFIMLDSYRQRKEKREGITDLSSGNASNLPDNKPLEK